MVLGSPFPKLIALYLMLASKFLKFFSEHPVRLLVYLRVYFFQNVCISMDTRTCIEIWCWCRLRLQGFSQLGEISSAHTGLSFCMCLWGPDGVQSRNW